MPRLPQYPRPKYPRSRGSLMLADILSNGITPGNINSILGKRATIAPWLDGRWTPSDGMRQILETSCGIPAAAWDEIVEPGDLKAVAAEHDRRNKQAHERHLTRRGIPKDGWSSAKSVVAKSVVAKSVDASSRDSVAKPTASTSAHLVARNWSWQRAETSTPARSGRKAQPLKASQAISSGMAKLRALQDSISQRQVAIAIGADQTGVSRWCRGAAVPGMVFRQRLAEKYGIGAHEWVPAKPVSAKPVPEPKRTSPEISPLHAWILGNLVSELITPDQASAMLSKLSGAAVESAAE